MGDLRRIEQHCNQLLNASDFDDYCPNGLQVDGGVHEIKRIVTGVTASQALVDQAIALNADLLMVHHGYFWRGERQPLIGIKGARIRALLQNGVSLMAYHLPLDAHPALGNNRRLGEVLGFADAKPVSNDEPLLWGADLPAPESAKSISIKLSRALQQEPVHLSAGEQMISRIGWCTGAAQGMIEQAAAAGLDAFISGEASESTTHLALELGVHYFMAGHHATERFGVQALGEHLAKEFALEHQFVDIPNQV